MIIRLNIGREGKIAIDNNKYLNQLLDVHVQCTLRYVCSKKKTVESN